MSDKYKDDQGRYLTQAMFKETSSVDMRKKFPPEFTLKEHDIKGYKSMKQLYMACEDPTEYSFAMEILGSWEHWQKLSNSTWFKPIVDAWREELEIKLRSKGIRTMAELAVKDKNKDAAKWLAQAGFKLNSNSRGRPSKEEVQGELKKQARLKADIEEDASRLGITLIK